MPREDTASNEPTVGNAKPNPPHFQQHSAKEIYSIAVTRRLSPFFNGEIDVLAEQQNEEKEKSGDRECFLTATRREFELLCPSIPFDTNQLLKKYIKFGIKGLNHRHGVSHQAYEDQAYVVPLDPDGRDKHIQLATYYIKSCDQRFRRDISKPKTIGAKD